jgi:hypothetical protein
MNNNIKADMHNMFSDILVRGTIFVRISQKKGKFVCHNNPTGCKIVWIIEISPEFCDL